MIRKQDVKKENLDEYMCAENQLIRKINRELVEYEGKTIEICVVGYSSEIRKKLKLLYKEAGWKIIEKEQRTAPFWQFR